MFNGLAANLFDSPDFKEDSVRELVIVPILNRLGWGPSGDKRVARSKKLTHPFISAGTRNLPVTLVPDYTLYCGDKALFVLDAKAPAEDVLNRKHIQQVYSYAFHSEVNCRNFGLCNGRRLVVFNMDTPQPVMDLRFDDFEAKWETIEKFLSPQFLLNPHLRQYRPDFGTKLQGLGFSRETELLFTAVRLNLFAQVSDKIFMAAADCNFGDVDHCASFDFHKRLLPQIVSGLPQALRQQFCRALANHPFKAAAGLCIEIDIAVRLGKETQGKDEIFIPLLIHKVFASRFNPTEVPGDPQDIPPDVFQLRKAFAVTGAP